MAFYSDIAGTEAVKLVARLKPQSIISLTDPVDFAGEDLAVPSFYLVCTKDQAIPLELQTAVCAGIPGIIKVFCDAGHSAYLSIPDEFLRLVIQCLEAKTSGEFGLP